MIFILLLDWEKKLAEQGEMKKMIYSLKIIIWRKSGQSRVR